MASKEKSFVNKISCTIGRNIDKFIQKAYERGRGNVRLQDYCVRVAQAIYSDGRVSLNDERPGWPVSKKSLFDVNQVR